MNRPTILLCLLLSCTSTTADRAEHSTVAAPVPSSESSEIESAEVESAEVETAEPESPPVSMTRLSAETLAERLYAPAERVRIVNFWATWCGPCKAEMPALAGFSSSRPDLDLIFVNLDHPKAASERVERFIADNGLQRFTHFRPASEELDLASKIPSWPDVLPITLVLNTDGTERHRIIGAADEERLAEAVGAQ